MKKDLLTSQWSILRILEESDEALTVESISNRTGLTKTTVRRHAKILVELGLLTGVMKRTFWMFSVVKDEVKS